MHNCIYCDNFEMIPLTDFMPLPCFQKFICEECGELQYIKHSRVDPVTYKPEAITVDEEAKKISIKDEDE